MANSYFNCAGASGRGRNSGRAFTPTVDFTHLKVRNGRRVKCGRARAGQYGKLGVDADGRLVVSFAPKERKGYAHIDTNGYIACAGLADAVWAQVVRASKARNDAQ